MEGSGTKDFGKKGWVLWYGREVELDGKYYLYSPDKKREMTTKELEEYSKIISWPEKLKWKALFEQPPDINPHVLPCKGRVIIEMAESQFYIPQFDKYFDERSISVLYQIHKRYYDRFPQRLPKATRRLSLMPIEAISFFQDYSTMLNE